MNKRVLFAVALVILVVSGILLATRPSTSVAQGLCEYLPGGCPLHACLKKDEIRIVGGPTDCKHNEQHLTLARGELHLAVFEAIVESTTEVEALKVRVAELEALELEVRIAELEALEARVAELEDLLQDFSRDGDDITITGANLHVVNGTGWTDDINGLGNVIIGYNEPRNDGTNDRSGSHMLVVGRANNYSAYGGIVVGYSNTAEGEFAGVSGGRYNTASGLYAFVSGGAGNTASGFATSVSGGAGNEASGQFASISGGYIGEAIATSASVSGGYENTASGEYASVGGGRYNTASGFAASVGGGHNNTASGDYASVGGGYMIVADYDFQFLP